jgi:GT2 family glycosyltransferase
MPETNPTPNIQDADHVRRQWSSQRGWGATARRMLWLWREKGTRYVLKRVLARLGHGTLSYESWIKQNDTLLPRDVAQIRGRIGQLQQQPIITLVLRLERPRAAPLQRVIDSVRGQLYENWQLCVASDCAHTPEIKALLDSYANADARIQIIACDIDGVHAGNAALAAGEFIGLLGQNDRLATHALYLVVEEINDCADVSLIYTDEDTIDEQGRRSTPCFKTDWNPDLFLSQDYIGHLVVYRRELIKSIGFRAGFIGCEDYDLALQAVERIAPSTIRHVPFVLVHREMKAGITKTGEIIAQNARRAIQDHLDRVGSRAIVEAGNTGDKYRVRWMLPTPLPRVSIIIPTRDRVELLRGAVDSIFNKTSYPDFEVVIVDNQSVDAAALSYLDRLAERPNIRVLRFDHPFNYSAINNFAAKQCKSPVLALLNNDILAIDDGWLTEMVSQAMRPEVGAVGAMLYYPDDVIQHAGVILGFGGVAVNCCNGLANGSRDELTRVEMVQNYSAVTAACLMTRASVFDEVNGFNETDLPVAFNDVDYCLRLRERGYLVTWTPYAKLYHLESVSRGDDLSPSKIERFRRDQAYMIKRWGRVLTNDPYYSPNYSLDSVPFALAAKPRRREPWTSSM